MARAMSGQRRRMARLSWRSRSASAKNPTASSRASMAPGSVKGAARCSARSRAPAPVTVRSMAAKQAALALARQRLGQLEVAPGRGIDLQEGAGRASAAAGATPAACPLRQLDVIHERARRRDLGAREIAEGVERLHALKPPRGASGRSRCRSAHWAGATARSSSRSGARTVRASAGAARAAGFRRARAARAPRRDARSPPPGSRNRRSRDRARRAPSSPPASAKRGQIIVAPRVEECCPR